MFESPANDHPNDYPKERKPELRRRDRVHGQDMDRRPADGCQADDARDKLKVLASGIRFEDETGEPVRPTRGQKPPVFGRLRRLQ